MRKKKHGNRPTFTAHTRLDARSYDHYALDAYAKVFSHAERCCYAMLAAEATGKSGVVELKKPGFMAQVGLSSRQFNAVLSETEAKIAAVKASRDNQIDTLKATIAKIKKTIKAKKTESKAYLYQLKNKLKDKEARLVGFMADKEAGRAPICFGKKSFFRKQFNLADNGYNNHAEWLADWRARRNNQFFVLGSHDETDGCSGCTVTVLADSSLVLRIRAPNMYAEIKDAPFPSDTFKYIVVRDVWFAHGHELILTALHKKQAISWRFLNDGIGWRVFAMTDSIDIAPYEPKPGMIGYDVNDGFLAVYEVDQHGNPLEGWRIPCNTYGKSKNQAKTVVGEAVKELCRIATEKQKPLAGELLDFAKKKAELEGSSAKRCRQLSSFKYSAINGMLDRTAYRNGVAIGRDNPAFTSTIGAINYARRYGLSTHMGAAIAIARRVLRLSERPLSEKRKLSFLYRDGAPGSFREPARIRGKHSWSQWRVISRKLKAAHVAHARSDKTGPSKPGSG